jgi:hypothetical protein
MSPARTLKAKEDKNLDSQAKTNSLFVVSESDIEVTHHTRSRAVTFKLNVRNDALRNRSTLLCALRATEV